jgi:hypothetical protein
MADSIHPYRIEIPDADIADLKRRLAATRWPEREPVDDWSQGTPLAYLQAVCTTWAKQYDWRATEARLNRLQVGERRALRPVVDRFTLGPARGREPSFQVGDVRVGDFNAVGMDRVCHQRTCRCGAGIGSIR